MTINSENKKKLTIIALCILAAILIIIPIVGSSYAVRVVVRYMYFGLLTISFAFLASQLGLFSMMAPVSMTITGYIIGLSTLRWGWSIWLGIIVAIAGTMAFAALCGLMVNHSKGTSFMMLTLVISQLVWALALQWTSVTNGTTGLLGIEFPAYINIFCDNTAINNYYWTLIVFAICVFAVYLLINSSYGLRLRGIRDSESRMRAFGYHTSFLKWTAFMVANLLSSIVGVLYVLVNGMITPDVMTLASTNKSLISSILGGVSSPLVGSMIGTVIYRTCDLLLSSITRRYLLFVGLMFLLIMLLLPDGLTSIIKKIGRGKKDEQ